MRPPLKLNAIEQEHLQELYDAAGVARDELPYSEKFDEIWSGFQDRTFKNAEREQVFGAILKYVRSSSNAASGIAIESKVNENSSSSSKRCSPAIRAAENCCRTAMSSRPSARNSSSTRASS